MDDSTAPDPADTTDQQAAPATTPSSGTTDPNDFTGFQVPPKFRSAIWASEGGPGTGLNKWGYAGAYQMGTSALNSAGLYKPAEGEDLSTNQWKGQITVPGYAPMGVQDFVKNQDAQDAAFNQHMAYLANQAHTMGLDKYIGQTVGGVPVTQETLASMMHFAGPAGTQRYLTSGGSYNPADGNNVKVAGYAGHVANYMGGQPVVPVPSSDTASNDGTSPPLHFPTSTPTAPTGNSQLQQQFAQLQKLNLLSKLSQPQQQQQVPYNSQFPWESAILNAGRQSNPLQMAIQVQQLKALQNGGSGLFNPLLTS